MVRMLNQSQKNKKGTQDTNLNCSLIFLSLLLKSGTLSNTEGKCRADIAVLRDLSTVGRVDSGEVIKDELGRGFDFIMVHYGSEIEDGLVTVSMKHRRSGRKHILVS